MRFQRRALQKLTRVACRFTHKLDEIVLSIVVIRHRGVPIRLAAGRVRLGKFAWYAYSVCWRAVFAGPQGWGILVRHSRTARRSAELGACNLYRREQMRRHRRRTLPLLLASMAPYVRYVSSPQPQPRPPRCLEEGSTGARAHLAQRLASTRCQNAWPFRLPGLTVSDGTVSVDPRRHRAVR